MNKETIVRQIFKMLKLNELTIKLVSHDKETDKGYVSLVVTTNDENHLMIQNSYTHDYVIVKNAVETLIESHIISLCEKQGLDRKHICIVSHLTDIKLKPFHEDVRKILEFMIESEFIIVNDKDIQNDDGVIKRIISMHCLELKHLLNEFDFMF